MPSDHRFTYHFSYRERPHDYRVHVRLGRVHGRRPRGTHTLKIERSGDKPVVRGTVITGVLREQAMLAAKALDGQEEGKWTGFALWLFGQNPDGKQGSDPHPHHVTLLGRGPGLGLGDPGPRHGIPVHRPNHGDGA